MFYKILCFLFERIEGEIKIYLFNDLRELKEKSKDKEKFI